MKIIAHSPLPSGKEHAETFRRVLAEGAPAWQQHRGLRRWFVRTGIWLWAWYETDRRIAAACRQNSRDRV